MTNVIGGVGLLMLPSIALEGPAEDDVLHSIFAAKGPVEHLRFAASTRQRDAYVADGVSPHGSASLPTLRTLIAVL